MEALNVTGILFIPLFRIRFLFLTVGVSADGLCLY